MQKIYSVNFETVKEFRANLERLRRQAAEAVHQPLQEFRLPNGAVILWHYSSPSDERPMPLCRDTQARMEQAVRANEGCTFFLTAIV